MLQTADLNPTSLQLLQAMGGSALLQQHLLAAGGGAESLLAPIGVQNLVTLAAMSQPTMNAQASQLCLMKDRSGQVCLGGGHQQVTQQMAPPSAASLSDLTGAYAGTLLGGAGLSTAAAAAAGKQVEGKNHSFTYFRNI